MAKKVRLFEVRTTNGHGQSDAVIYPAPSKIFLVDKLTTKDVKVDAVYIGWGDVTAKPSDTDEPMFEITHNSKTIAIEAHENGYGYLKQQCPKIFKQVEDYLNESEN